MAIRSESSNDTNDDEAESASCPFCGKLGQQCGQHLVLNFDVTFGTAYGPADALFQKFVYNDTKTDESEQIREFIDACETVCDCCRSCDSEGGPGQSSLEYWCWSHDVKATLLQLEAELAERA